MVPDYRKGNPYQSLLEDALKAKGIGVLFSNYPNSSFPLLDLIKQFPDIDVLHVHWISVLIERSQWSKKRWIFYLRCLCLVLECSLIRLKGKKIVWTIHNKKSHEQFEAKKELLFRKLFFRLVNKVILHSKEAMLTVSKLYGFDISAKTNIILHGNYQNVYPKATGTKLQLKAKYGITGNHIVIAYLGYIKPYKGIELLIKSFEECDSSDKILFLAGSISCNDYKNKIIRQIGDNHKIVHEFKFLSNQEMINVLEFVDFVCLPFSDTLTSGSTILAMTQGKPLILPEVAKVFGCVPNDGVKYFSCRKELVDIINNLTLEDADRMGKINNDKAITMNWKHVANMTTTVYE